MDNHPAWCPTGAMTTQHKGINMRHVTYLLALAVLCAACVAQADTRLVYSGDQDNFVVSVRPGEVRIDADGDGWQLYRQDSNTLFAVDPAHDSYRRMDEDTAAILQQRMAELRAKIEAQLKQLPKDRRDIARAILADKVPGFSPESQQVSLQPTGDYDEVAGVRCEITQVIRDGEAAERMCIASADALGLSDAEFDTLKAMFGLMHSMLAGTGFENIGLPYMQLSGMPVRFHAPQGDTQRTLISVSHDSLDDALFTLPDDLHEQAPVVNH